MAKFDFTKDEIDNLYKIIGTNVKKYRKATKITQMDLAYEMGCKSVSLVSASEPFINNKHFNIEHLYKISKILDVPITSFFETVDNKDL
jgi:transcriptional regulator with XRE-family HTH domain